MQSIAVRLRDMNEKNVLLTNVVGALHLKERGNKPNRDTNVVDATHLRPKVPLGTTTFVSIRLGYCPKVQRTDHIFPLA